MYPFDYDDDFYDRYDDNNDSMRRNATSQIPMPGFPGFPGGGPPFGSPGGGGRPPFGSPSGGQPPFGPPGGGQPPFGTPGGGGGQFGGQLQAPTSPPPSFTPQMSNFQQQEFNRQGGVGSIRRCMFRNTFIWLWNGNSFWFFPMLILGNQIIGFRWRGNRGWVYDSINRNSIMFFQCF